MKNSILLINFFFFSGLVCNAQDFITTWNIGFNSTSLGFETVTTGPVNYTWQSTTTSASGAGTFQGPQATINGLPENATIELFIEPQNLKRFKYISLPFINPYSLVEVSQWGAVQWETMESAFSNINASFVVSATDIPDLSNCTSLKNMFSGNFSLNSPFNINFWDISNVTDLSGMFQGASSFNQALSQWDTSNVTSMSSMFEEAWNFNQNIGSWDTSNVTNLSKMFKNAFSFDRNIGNWNTANVQDMSELFFCDINSGFVSSFNKNIGAWNTSSVVNMASMFRGAVVFNQNIGNWDTSNVTDMSNMFRVALVFNQNIGNWDTSSVTNMTEMFRRDELFFSNNLPENYAFNNGGSLSIENWDTSQVVDMTRMFFNANNFNKNLENWILNDAVVLTGMLDNSGLDCQNYSLTLIGWSNNPETPTNKLLGATFLEYGPEALSAINNLVLNKGWAFSGHDMISTIPEFIVPTQYCEADEIPPLPEISEEGISGTWQPEINQTQTTTYTFTPNEGECAIETFITISITPSVQPTFQAIDPICVGDNIADLPSISENGITGSWSPPINNQETTVYTFLPDTDECAPTATLTIVVNSGESPIGEEFQSFSFTATIEDIQITPSNVTWYPTFEDAVEGTNALPSSTLLESSTSYYAVNESGECRSQPFMVTIDLNFSIVETAEAFFDFYPNPVTNQLFITGKIPINQVEVFDLHGRLLLSEKYDYSEIALDLTHLPSSNYILKIVAENQNESFVITKL